MLQTIGKALKFMTSRERSKYFAFLALRSFAALFDLLGILAIGFLATSIALFVTLGSDANRVIEFAGLSLPAVNVQTLPSLAVTILALFLVKAVLSIILTRQLAFFLARIEARAAKTVAERALGSGLETARRNTKEEVYFAVQAGSPAAFNSVLNSLGIIAAEGILFALVIAAFLAVDPMAALAALAYFSFIGVFIHLFLGRLMEKAAASASLGAINANAAIGDLSEVLREATILGKTNVYFNRIYQARIQAASSTASQLTMGGMPRYIVETSLIIAIASFALWQLLSGDLVSAAGTLGVFMSGGLRLTASLLPLQTALLVIRQSLPVAQRALDLIDQPGGATSAKGESLQRSRASLGAADIQLEGVSFGYPDSEKLTISDLNMSVQPGSQIALIGPSGGGKSTIADLILGLLLPSQGSVSVDGQSPSEVVSSSPGRLAYVPQRPGLVSGSIRDNIALGLSEASLNFVALENALRLSHLTEFVSSLPEGIDTPIGKRRDELSGGQLQRIGLARALYSSPSLIVMDEATSALDAQSEDEINKALDDMRGKVTVVLIAHRLNTVQRSDTVFLIEEGAITASGTFAELLASSPTVNNLAKLMAVDQPNS
jgi:ABC-type multidrug transport system fused ATPase/permease subunit